MPFVAAVVCNNYGNMRYKLFGGSSLSGTFMEILLYSSCDNNCDLVYGYPYDEVRSTLASAFSSNCHYMYDCRAYQGYYRNSNNGQLRYQTGCPYNYNYYSHIYTECGIQVP
ncbi:uncharacterized protein LOC134245623 [Saccostrea cucullata]|uniref:uncharacterized protein LOC134245623 n=1 Tax=Saccostrea cuccullata TaxID=36930 RepID=UPI002ED1106D